MSKVTIISSNKDTHVRVGIRQPDGNYEMRNIHFDDKGEVSVAKCEPEEAEVLLRLPNFSKESFDLDDKKSDEKKSDEKPATAADFLKLGIQKFTAAIAEVSDKALIDEMIKIEAEGEARAKFIEAMSKRAAALNQ